MRNARGWFESRERPDGRPGAIRLRASERAVFRPPCLFLPAVLDVQAGDARVHIGGREAPPCTVGSKVLLNARVSLLFIRLWKSTPTAWRRAPMRLLGELCQSIGGRLLGAINDKRRHDYTLPLQFEPKLLSNGGE
jgi:hypothetical protein